MTIYLDPFSYLLGMATPFALLGLTLVIATAVRELRKGLGR